MPLLIPVLVGFPVLIGGGWVIYRIFTWPRGGDHADVHVDRGILGADQERCL